MADRESIWDALGRRKVLRSTGIYLAIAWLVLQVTGLIGDIWGAPGWTPQAVFVLLALGLPIVATLSWVYDIGDDGLVETRGAGFFELLRRKARRGRFQLVVMVVLLLTVAAFGVAHLWPDEDLSPDVRRLIANAHRSSSDPQSLNFGLYGLTAPAGRDFWQYGRFRVAANNVTGAMPTDAEPMLRVTLQSKDLCRFREPGCLERTEQELDGVPVLLEANAELMARYEALHGARAFGEVIRYSVDAPFPDIEPMQIAQRLKLRALWRDFANGDRATAWRGLDAELAFHRRMLAESSSILIKSVAIRMLEQDLRLWSLLAARAAASRDQSGFPAAAPARLSLAERSMVAAMAWEGTANVTLIEGMSDKTEFATQAFEGPIPRLLFVIAPFKRNATLNRVVQPVMDAARASLMDQQEFEAYAAAYKHKDVGVADVVFNGAGAIIVAIAPDFLQYVRRAHTLDSLIVLVRAHHRLMAQRVTQSSVNGALLALPADLHDPLRDVPPVWSDGMLKFDRSEVSANDLVLELPLAL